MLMRKFAAGVLLLFISHGAYAQNGTVNKSTRFIELKTLIEDAVKTANRDSVHLAIDGFERLTVHDSLHYLVHYYLAYGWYQLYSFSTDESFETRPDFLEKAVEFAEASIAANNEFSEAWIILGNAFGIKADNGLLSAIRYAPKAKNRYEKALELDPANPRAAMYMGVASLYQPGLLGGSTEKAIEMLIRSVELFETSKGKKSHALWPDWGHAEAYAWLGLAYEQNDEFESAKEAYYEALFINPNYRWVRDKLLPGLLRKTEN